ncbi:MAG TPA: helix-turn-helix domain-containing protein, partial [Pseudobdellovibrionaceae bacterium]|nr:helix-turn-helix domain-containing protein [Pseudobdellovibrionaceae bacterium]
MKRTGEMLQKAREEKGLSLNEIALSLKINSKVLSAIEAGDTSKLPAKTFLRGFVQSYANYLKIDTNQVMETFAEEMSAARPLISTDPQATSPEGTVQEPASPIAHREEPVFTQIEKRNNTKLFVITGVCLVLVSLIFVTARIVDRYQKETITEEVQVTSPLPDDSNPEPESEQVVPSSEETETDEASATTVVTTPATPPAAPPTPPPAVVATPAP